MLLDILPPGIDAQLSSTRADLHSGFVTTAEPPLPADEPPDVCRHLAIHCSDSRLQVVFGGINASKEALDDLAVLQARRPQLRPRESAAAQGAGS